MASTLTALLADVLSGERTPEQWTELEELWIDAAESVRVLISQKRATHAVAVFDDVNAIERADAE